jgi:acetyltransferase-like isoleucine patch superfamily enzyme
MTRKIIHELYDPGRGMLRKYKRLRVGDAGWGTFILFELVTMLLANLQGALGLYCRSRLYRPFFRRIGRGVVFGVGVSIRNPGRICLGDHVVIDDYVVLDAKGNNPDGGIILGNRVFVSRNVILGCKNGAIRLGNDISIGPHSTIHSVDRSTVDVGDYTVMAAYCYVIGAPDYKTDRIDVPMAEQGFEPGRGIAIGRDTWLGACATVLDGTRIGDGAVIGAKALVRRDIAPYAVAAGIPATIRRMRAPGAPAEPGVSP